MPMSSNEPNLVEPQSENSPSTEESAPRVSFGKRFVGWVKASRLHAAILAGAVIASIGGVCVLWFAFGASRSEEPQVTLEMALEALDNGQFPEARQMAERLREQVTLRPHRRGTIAFVLGIVAMHEADATWASDKTNYHLVAARYLDESRDRGFPPGRDAEGIYALGRCLYLSGQIESSRSVLREALAVNPQRKTELHRLLASAYSKGPNPKYAEALEQNQLFLSAAKLPPAERSRGLIQRAQIQIEMGRVEACEDTLREIPANVDNRSDVMLLRGRVLMEQARRLKKNVKESGESKVRAKYEAAIKVLREAQTHDTLVNEASRRSMYLIGVCFLDLSDPKAALTQFVRTRTLYADTAEGQAANFQEAELHRQAGRDNEALAAYRRVISPVHELDSYANPWLPLDTLRTRLVDAYRSYLNGQKFGVALQLIDMLPVFLGEVRTTEMRGEARRAWGRYLSAQAERLLPPKTAPVASQARQQLRLAGSAFARLAELRSATRHYPDDLWESAVSDLEGQDYRSAARLLQQYLTAESRRRQPQALAYLGEALLSLGQTDEALTALRECIDLYPRDPMAFRARLLASDACMEKHDVELAESFLRENLSGDYLTPASKEWRDSLFALGRLLHNNGRYDEAVPRLDEAIRRYPDVPQAIEARYLKADSLRRCGEAVQEKLRKELAENARVAHSKTARDYLNAALVQYKDLLEVLNRRQENVELSPQEKAMLRNAYFTIGDIHYALEQYEAAVRAYTVATNRYQTHPEVLEAYLQIVRAYQRMRKPAEARIAAEQAKGVLGRLKADVDFEETTNRSRQQWTELFHHLVAGSKT